MNSFTMPKPLNLNTVLTYDQRSLIYLKDQDDTVNWSSWPSIVVGIDSYKKWSNKQTRIVGIIIDTIDDALENTDEQFETIHSISKEVSLIAIPLHILQLQPVDYWTENYNNLINLNEMYNTFPNIIHPWDGTTDDAIASIGIILRSNRIIDINPSINRLNTLKMYNISVETEVKPYSIWLFTQFFRHENNRRHREIKECLANNLLCNFIDKVVLINEKDHSSEFPTKNTNKIMQIITGKRLTYYDFFKTVYDIAPDNCIVILANADIYFDDTINEIHKLNMSNKMLALLRWDVQQNRDDSPKLFGPRSDSQDSWIFLSDSIKSRTWDPIKFNYQLGMPGCDNRITSDVLRMKFLISNPALSIKSYHIHNTNIRNYTMANKIPSDVYVLITPTHILDMKHMQFPSNKPVYLENTNVEFEIKSSTMSNAITYCTMLEKQGRYTWEYGVENYYFDKIPIYSWKNSCVTPNGLVYDFNNIYTGNHTEKFNYWNNANVNIFTPLQKAEKMLAIPMANTDIFSHPDTYTLQYLAHVARLRKEYPGASFWIPHTFSSFIQQFNFNTNEINGLYFDNKSAAFADEVIGLLPGPSSQELGKENIDSLRQLYPPWQSKPTSKKCVILTNPILSTNFSKNIQEVLGEEWEIVTIHEKISGRYDQLCGASLCIFIGGKDTEKNWSKLWALPSECCVIEFQQELQIDGQFQHLAHIAGFKSWIYLLSKASESDIQNKILESFKKWFDKNSDELVF